MSQPYLNPNDESGNYFELFDQFSGNVLGDFDTLDEAAIYADTVVDGDSYELQAYLTIVEVDPFTGEVISRFNGMGQRI